MTGTRSLSSQAKRVLLLVEFALRDLPSCVHLKYLLERNHGCDVRLAPPHLEREATARFRPHLVVFSHLRYPDSIARAHELRRRRVGVAVLHTEGTSIKEPVKQIIAGRLSDLGAADIQFTWNEEIASLIRQFHPEMNGRVHVAGCPRMDFYVPPLQQLHIPTPDFCRRHGLQAGRPIVTWATNFGWVRYEGDRAVIDEIQQRYHREGLAQFDPWDDIAGIVRRESVSRRLQTDAFVALAGQYPNVSFVLKPHPVEDVDWYAGELRRAGLSNAVVVARESIWDVLSSTSVHLHRSCTTAVEAWLLGRPTIDLMLNPEEWFRSEELAAGGDVVTGEERLIQRVGAYLEGAPVAPAMLAARRDVIRRWFDRVDGRSAERHAAVMAAFLAERDGVEPACRIGVADAAALARAVVRRALGVGTGDSLRSWSGSAYRESRDKFFTDADVAHWMGEIDAALGSERPAVGFS